MIMTTKSNPKKIEKTVDFIAENVYNCGYELGNENQNKSARH